ncbi:hypothetical protein RHGRI_024497 [Rhododendron griersonianum]|uniref:Uncharacterized protein n=1 Tax=Rhododendron griersonianum TaxID=479676 RepID=A0AAV6J7N6_9ERIC|nr:hypothetical protein RHGRI_024497 [Rhododendron griersonianum]
MARVNGGRRRGLQIGTAEKDRGGISGDGLGIEGDGCGGGCSQRGQPSGGDDGGMGYRGVVGMEGRARGKVGDGGKWLWWTVAEKAVERRR